MGVGERTSARLSPRVQEWAFTGASCGSGWVACAFPLGGQIVCFLCDSVVLTARLSCSILDALQLGGGLDRAGLWTQDRCVWVKVSLVPTGSF